MRIAIISTPRSGNTWVRRVIRDCYGLTEYAVHHPRDIPPDLAKDAILQLHWYADLCLRNVLADGGFGTIVIARHPLDVLLSVLHFVKYEPQTNRWLDGDVQLPPNLAGSRPTSEEFLRYALSAGAKNLLSVSYAWWNEPSVLRLRYEDLVKDPVNSFGRATAALGDVRMPLQEALQASQLSIFQATPNRHGWQGRPGLWRSLITPDVALRIYFRHRHVFRTLGYGITPYVLRRAKARENWDQLTRPA